MIELELLEPLVPMEFSSCRPARQVAIVCYMSDFALSLAAHDWIFKNFPEGSTILELGSGLGSEKLAEKYQLYSVEHDEKWVNKFPRVKYIYAPLKEHKQVARFNSTLWYDKHIIEDTKKIPYQLIICDGPPGGSNNKSGRAGLLKYLNLFKDNVPILCDDFHRSPERLLTIKLSAKYKTPFVVYGAGTEKLFAVIWPGKEV